MAQSEDEALARAALERLARVAVENGQLIEAGWISLRHVMIHPDAGQAQLDDMRTAFFGGAQHLWTALMTVMDPDAEPTAADLARCDLIQSELSEFTRQLAERLGIQLEMRS